MKTINYFTLFFAIAIIFSCNNKQTADNKSAELVNIPEFSADSAYNYIVKQVSFGHRVPNSEAHTNTCNWLVNKLKEYTEHVQMQPMRLVRYDGQIINGTNIIVTFNKENINRILLAAHWDTRPWADYDSDKNNSKVSIEGANDGASGVAVLIELARHFSINKPKIGVDIIFFDAEDSGEHRHSGSSNEKSWCLGSQYWSKNPHIPGYNARFGILLDMVGAKDAVFAKEANSIHYAPNIINKVWQAADRLGYSNYFIDKNEYPLIDDHTFINTIAGIPCIDIIDYDSNRENGFFKHWHTVNDRLDQIDVKTLKVVGQTVMTVVYEME